MPLNAVMNKFLPFPGGRLFTFVICEDNIALTELLLNSAFTGFCDVIYNMASDSFPMYCKCVTLLRSKRFLKVCFLVVMTVCH